MISDMIRRAAERTDVSVQAIKGPRNNRLVFKVRAGAMLAAYDAKSGKHGTASAVGRAFGNRDHSTVRHACEKARSYLEAGDETVRAAYNAARGCEAECIPGAVPLPDWREDPFWQLPSLTGRTC